MSTAGGPAARGTSAVAPPGAPAPGPAAWRRLVEALDAAGTTVAELAGRVPDVDVAEGFRYVLHVLADQVDRAALRDSSCPLFLPGITPVRKLFFDNPDTSYDTAFIRGDRTYRIRGHRGRVTYLAFCVYSGRITRGETTRVANLVDADMAFEPDGSFELTLSPDEHPGNWIRLEPDAHLVIARQYVLDRHTETPATYDIEVVARDDTENDAAGIHVDGDERGHRGKGDAGADDPGGRSRAGGDASPRGGGGAVGPGVRPDPPFDGDRFARLAGDAAAFVATATTVARDRAEGMAAQPNRFVEIPGHGLYGTPDAGYVACWYRLAPGEALVVDVHPPACRYWGVHLANRWGQSLDHRTRPTALNASSAVLAVDGSVRVVVAGHDPGGPNWLDTAGHPEGWALFRWLLADHVEVPEARVVPIADLALRHFDQKGRDADT